MSKFLTSLFFCLCCAQTAAALIRKEQTLTLPADHIIAGQITGGAIGGYFAGTLGLEYDRFITRQSWLSVQLNGMAFLGGNVHLPGGEPDAGTVRSKSWGYIAAPGIRFHPLRNRYLSDISIGVSFPTGWSARRDDVFGTYPINTEQKKSHFFGAYTGELVANFLFHNGHGVFSLFLSAGRIYSNVGAVTYYFPNKQTAHSENDPLFVQFGIRFGGGWRKRISPVIMPAPR